MRRSVILRAMDGFSALVPAASASQPWWLTAALALALGAFLLAAGSIIVALRARNATRAFLHQAMRKSADPHTLLPALIQEHDNLAQRTASLEEALASLRKEHQFALQYHHIVRFNPFVGDGTGGNQSFSLALLDGTASGIIITSIHGRDRTRIYSKPVVRGVPQTILSEEEQEALQGALERAALAGNPKNTTPAQNPHHKARLAKTQEKG
ncbi:DUF4446 family protein [Candidatus Parcubacteria bacterium]|nr:MAG: DUF4446 family protein [Candidatus Parcubacteria bacterium]